MFTKPAAFKPEIKNLKYGYQLPEMNQASSGYKLFLSTANVKVGLVVHLGARKLDADQLEGCLFSSFGKPNGSKMQRLYSTQDVCIREIKCIQAWFRAIEGRFPRRIQGFDRVVGTLPS